MTSRTITRCDRCHHDIPEQDCHVQLALEARIYPSASASGKVEQIAPKADLCERCYGRVRDAITREMSP